MECYRQYIHHFKSEFPYVSAQSFNEGKINMKITIMTGQIRRVTRGGGEFSLVLSRKMEKSVRILGKYTWL